MSTASATLTTWEEFLLLPDEEEYDKGNHLELHDGEVVVVPPPRSIHQYAQNWLAAWFTDAAKGRGWAAVDLFYRPAANLQFWRADVAYLPKEDWQALRRDDYIVYSPPLIIEVLSPSNRRAKIDHQRMVAFSGGTREFRVVDLTRRTIEVTVPGRPSRVYGENETIAVTVLRGVVFPVSELFRD
jgi:Uma2 family endonuclease